jgi:hypothetical protein
MSEIDLSLSLSFLPLLVWNYQFTYVLLLTQLRVISHFLSISYTTYLQDEIKFRFGESRRTTDRSSPVMNVQRLMEQECCGCHEPKEVFTLRKGVTKCAECICNQIGRSTMDLFRKAIKSIPPPIHVLLVCTGDPSSTFVNHLLKTRLKLGFEGKSAVVKKIQSISSNPRPGIELQLPQLTPRSIANFARNNGFNCIILGDDASRVALASLGAVSCGRPDLLHWLSTDDFESFPDVAILRPVRQCLSEETRFYCRFHGLEFEEEIDGFERGFVHEKKMLDDVVGDGHGAAAFAVQKLAMRLPGMAMAGKCGECGLPVEGEGLCEMCSVVYNV